MRAASSRAHFLGRHIARIPPMQSGDLKQSAPIYLDGLSRRHTARIAADTRPTNERHRRRQHTLRLYQTRLATLYIVGLTRKIRRRPNFFPIRKKNDRPRRRGKQKKTQSRFVSSLLCCSEISYINYHVYYTWAVKLNQNRHKGHLKLLTYYIHVLIT